MSDLDPLAFIHNAIIFCIDTMMLETFDLRSTGFHIKFLLEDQGVGILQEKLEQNQRVLDPHCLNRIKRVFFTEFKKIKKKRISLVIKTIFAKGKLNRQCYPTYPCNHHQQ